MNWTRRHLLASGIAAGLTACSPASIPRNKAGGPLPPVTLTLGTPDYPATSPPQFQDITHFARQVRQLSGAQISIRILWGVAQEATDFEAVTVSLVRDGQVDLGWVGARAWDTRGVRSFQALQAPFLIDSYPLLDAVLTSPMATQMLAGLNQAGFTGLGLYPEQLRHLVGFRKPLASLRDLRGARIRVPSSRASDALFRALGAVPVHLGGSAFPTAVASRTVDGVDASTGLAATAGGKLLTRNITLYARTSTLFASAGRFAKLTPSQQQVLRSAARRTLPFALATPPEPGSLALFCSSGGKVVTASEPAVNAIERAADPVYAYLEQDPQTTVFIRQIQQMKQQFPAPATVAAC